jgi:hypothetical protein
MNRVNPYWKSLGKGTTMLDSILTQRRKDAETQADRTRSFGHFFAKSSPSVISFKKEKGYVI